MHITLDGYVTEHKSTLYHQAGLASFLVLAAEHLGMQRLGPPHIVQYQAKDGQPVSGLSGVQFIAESSITAHTYPELDFIYLDLFSCKAIDAVSVKRIIKYLGLLHYTRKVNPTRGHTHLLEVEHGGR